MNNGGRKGFLTKKLVIVFLVVFVLVAGGVTTGLLVSNNIRQEKERISAEEKRAEEERIENERREAERIAEEERLKAEKEAKEAEEKAKAEKEKAQTSAKTTGNCTLGYGNLMLINPNFTVTTSWIASRKTTLISVSKTYGIKEGKASNGDNLMNAEAAEHLNEMVKAYEKAYPGYTMVTRSCFRQKGTTCGRLCAKTGTSDHHTGLTCDLIDSRYKSEDLSTDNYKKHAEWQWLKANSYKYGFIDRFPVAWAGGSMSQPINVDANGTTGLYETWHYRYVGVMAATEIATGKYNNGKYDSLEHYLKMTGKVSDLKNAKC